MAPTKSKLSRKSRKSSRRSKLSATPSLKLFPEFPSAGRDGGAAGHSCLSQSLRLSPCPDGHGQRSRLCRAFKRLLRVAEPERNSATSEEADHEIAGNLGSVPDDLRELFQVTYSFIADAVDSARAKAAMMGGVTEDVPLPGMRQHLCPGSPGQCRSSQAIGRRKVPLVRRRLRRQLRKDLVIHLDPADLPAVGGGPNYNVITNNSVTTVVRGGKAFDIVID